jgi:hypothetical protein
MSEKSKRKNMLEAILARGDEVAGERTSAEIAYDDEVLAGLDSGLSIEAALAKAAETYPDEALQVDESQIEDVAAHYEFLGNHIKILHLMEALKRK